MSRIDDALAAAHNAPMARIGQRHTGERHITDHTDAYARHGAEWCRLADEADRREVPDAPAADDKWDGSDVTIAGVPGRDGKMVPVEMPDIPSALKRS